MQRQNSNPGARRTTRPAANSKRPGNASSRNANTTSSKIEAARSFRQTAVASAGNDKPQATRRSKNNNTTQGKRLVQPEATRPSAPRGEPSAQKRGAQGSARRPKTATTNNKNSGRATPVNRGKGSSAKPARSSK